MIRYQNADQRVIGFVVENLAASRTAWLCTVLSTWGSSPRPKGSLFALNELGEKAGTLSGGCVEEDLVERTLMKFLGGPRRRDEPLRVIVFSASAEEAGVCDYLRRSTQGSC
jgi:xanthine dehydrogenase accessory factor